VIVIDVFCLLPIVIFISFILLNILICLFFQEPGLFNDVILSSPETCRHPRTPAGVSAVSDQVAAGGDCGRISGENG